MSFHEWFIHQEIVEYNVEMKYWKYQESLWLKSPTFCFLRLHSNARNKTISLVINFQKQRQLGHFFCTSRNLHFFCWSFKFLLRRTIITFGPFLDSHFDIIHLFLLNLFYSSLLRSTTLHVWIEIFKIIILKILFLSFSWITVLMGVKQIFGLHCSIKSKSSVVFWTFP